MPFDLLLDFDRYKKCEGFSLFEPSLLAIVSYRTGQLLRRVRLPVIGQALRAVHVIVHGFVTVAVGIHLPRGTSIGPGLRIYHFGGIIISPSATIGRNCTLRQNVCIGTRYGKDDAPTIGDNVDFGVGAVVIGRVRIGNDVHVGANAVVLTDVPDNASAVGVPARIVLRASKTTHPNVFVTRQLSSACLAIGRKHRDE